MTILYLFGFFVLVWSSTGQTSYSVITRKFETIPESGTATIYYSTTRPLIECLLLCENDVNCNAVTFYNVSQYCYRSTDNVLEFPSTVLTALSNYKIHYKVPRCPNGWNWFRYRCYKFIDANMTWNDSRDNCEALGGWLALPRSMAHVSFFNNITTCIPGPSTCFPWIGMHDLDTEGIYQGVEGFAIPTSVVSATFDNQDAWDCAFIDPEPGWDDVYFYDCMDLATSVCERLE